MGTDVGSVRGCESRNVRAEDEDGMAKWQRYERGMRRRSYKALSPPFRIREFLGNRSRGLRLSEFSNAAYGPLLRLSRNRSPCCSFIATVSCYSPNNRRLLRHLLRLTNRYCTAIPLVFSPRLGFSDISVNGSGTGCLLGWFFLLFSCF